MSGRGVDAFEVLGLPYDPDLSDERVHDAYRLRLRATHPDNGGDEVCAAAVTAAYSALRSGVRRAELLGAVSLEALAGQDGGLAQRERPPWLRGPWAGSARRRRRRRWPGRRGVRRPAGRAGSWRRRAGGCYGGWLRVRGTVRGCWRCGWRWRCWCR